MKKLINQRVAMLIDAENVELHARNAYNTRIDYEKLIQEISPREVIRALYFKPVAKFTKSWEQVLAGWGYEVKASPKNADCWLTISAVTLAEKCDVVVLVGGDSDYLPLLWYLQSKGVKTEVWSWLDCTSIELKNVADEFIPLTPDILIDKPNNLVTLNPKRRKSYA